MCLDIASDDGGAVCCGGVAQLLQQFPEAARLRSARRRQEGDDCDERGECAA